MHLLSFICLLFGFSWACAECPSKFHEVSGSCYHFGNEQAFNWDNARIHCSDLDPDADLATFDDRDQFAQVVNYLMYEGYDVEDGWSYWIGATDHGEEGVWKWVDINQGDVPMGVPMWGVVGGQVEPGVGNGQHCATLYKGDRYLVHDTSCTANAYPLCQYMINN